MVQYFGNPRNPRRRSYAIDPSTLGLLAWFEVGQGTYTDAGTTPAVADDLIYRIPDLTGNGAHADQSTSGVRPQLKTVSGFNVARFASTDYMEFLSLITVPQNAGMEVMIVAQSANGANAMLLFNNSPNRQLRYGDTANQLQCFDAASFPSSNTFGVAISGNWHCFGWSVPASSSTLTFYEGTTARGTGSFRLDLGDMPWKYIGTPTGPEYPQLDLAAIYIKAGQFTAQERAGLVAYAAALHA